MVSNSNLTPLDYYYCANGYVGFLVNFLASYKYYNNEITNYYAKNILDKKKKKKKIITLYLKYGNKWKEIACYFPDRNANMIKNRFYSFLKKKNNIQGINSIDKSSSFKLNVRPNNSKVKSEKFGIYQIKYPIK